MVAGLDAIGDIAVAEQVQVVQVEVPGELSEATVEAELGPGRDAAARAVFEQQLRPLEGGFSDGVEVVERNEFFAQITSSTTQSTCDAIVSFAALGYFATDASKPVTQIRDETIKARGLDPADIKWADETTKNRDYSASYELGEGPKGEPPIKGWIAFKEKAGTTFWVGFETHPNAWNAVGKSFQESAKRMLITKK